MTFRQILETIVNQTPGALAGAIMASDGIPVDEYLREGTTLELSSVAVEFQRVLEQSRKVAGALYGESGAGLEELILITGANQLFFRQIDDEFFIAIALEPTGMLGKARYLVRSLLDDLREEL
jgi:predicted regulator of Ras-like GTPase activity (Roadblock/LC7/MglB family)